MPAERRSSRLVRVISPSLPPIRHRARLRGNVRQMPRHGNQGSPPSEFALY